MIDGGTLEVARLPDGTSNVLDEAGGSLRLFSRRAGRTLLRRAVLALSFLPLYFLTILKRPVASLYLHQDITRKTLLIRKSTAAGVTGLYRAWKTMLPSIRHP